MALARGVISRGGQAAAVAAAAVFAAFVAAKGIPTLRHDWSWPIDRMAIPSFLNESAGGWVQVGFGVPNSHPTTYLAALPLALAMWIFGPLPALAIAAFATGYACMRAVASVATPAVAGYPAAIGIGLFALFNPWVYSEVVAGHLLMVLAYAGLIGMLAELARGDAARPVRVALWLALVALQLQFFVLAMPVLVVFAVATRMWLPVGAGTLFALPSIAGLVADRGSLLAIPYTLAWQKNQSLPPLDLVGLGGYFAGYSDRLGVAAILAVWILLGLALAGLIARRRSRLAVAAALCALALYVAMLGANGPLAAAYEWIVRGLPESGVFRELYDLAGVYAALLTLLACAATIAWRTLGYVALCAGATLLLAWMARPPSDLWIAASAYPHPAVAAAPYERVALLPAFQPLGLRAGGGDGADPDVRVYPGGVAALNSYLPAYPVDMALARYERDGDDGALRALGVGEVAARPYLVSRSNGSIGLAARSLAEPAARAARDSARHPLAGAAPLVSACDAYAIVAFADSLDACDVFFGDAANAVRPVAAQGDSLDPRAAWIDARLVFAQIPELAQSLGGAFTLSRVPIAVRGGTWLLVYVRGALYAGERELYAGRGGFRWIAIPSNVAALTCDGLCELVAQAASPPPGAPSVRPNARPMRFTELTPWLYVVESDERRASLLRLNVRYDPAWVAMDAWRALPHVRAGAVANGWELAGASFGTVFLIERTALVQAIAEICGIVCLLWLLKALVREPTKRAP